MVDKKTLLKKITCKLIILFLQLNTKNGLRKLNIL